MRFLYNKYITNWASSASITKWSKCNTKVIKDWINTKDYNVFLNCCLPGKQKMKSGKWLMSEECWCHRMQNQWGLSCMHTSVHFTLPAPPRSSEPQSSLSHIITILQEGHKRDTSTCILFSLCPQEPQGRHLFPGETANSQVRMIGTLSNFNFSSPARNRPDLCLNRFVTQRMCFPHNITSQEHKFSVPRYFPLYKYFKRWQLGLHAHPFMEQQTLWVFLVMEKQYIFN